MKLASLLDNVNLEQIVKESIQGAKEQPLEEAYVSKVKQFAQTSEFVSQKTKDTHAKLYNDYVDGINRVSAELDTAPRGLEDLNSSHSKFRSLKLDETYNLNSKWLHELYFANCFDPHSEVYMESLSYMKLQRDFGTFDAWQKDLIACALTAGNGWAVTGYHTHLQRYINTIVSNNSQDVMLGFYPVLVIDMHEHAYFRDYLNDKKSYAIAMMREINWNVVEERVAKAESIAQVLK